MSDEKDPIQILPEGALPAPKSAATHVSQSEKHRAL